MGSWGCCRESQEPEEGAGGWVGQKREWNRGTSHSECRRGISRRLLSMEDNELMMQALLGFERTMTHLDGRTIPLSRNGTTQPNEVEVIEGEGVSLPFTLSVPPAPPPGSLSPSFATAAVFFSPKWIEGDNWIG